MFEGIGIHLLLGDDHWIERVVSDSRGCRLEYVGIQLAFSGTLHLTQKASASWMIRSVSAFGRGKGCIEMLSPGIPWKAIAA